MTSRDIRPEMPSFAVQQTVSSGPLAKRSYRTGGDEFIVIDRESGREDFHACVRDALWAMQEEHIAIACGISWRDRHGDIDEQVNEADREMYLDKQAFHACLEHDRRHCRPERG